MLKMIIDTDIGDDIDDALALAFALKRPELDVKAITTVSGLTGKRGQIIKKMLGIMKMENIPVGVGMQLPLRRLSSEERDRFTEYKRGWYWLNYYSFIKEGEAQTYQVHEEAINLIIRTVEQHENDISLVAMGPLTNVAAALQRAPHIAPKLKWIAVMGGEVNLNRREHNISWDPHAAETVFASGVPLFLGTWDVTRRFVLMPEHCEAIKNHHSPLCDALSGMIGCWWPYKGWKPGPVMYDIAPVIWSFKREYYPTKPMEIRVETRGEFTTGMTVPGGGTPNAEVTVDMRADEVLNMFMETICG